MALDTSMWVHTRSSITHSPALPRTSTFLSKQTLPTRKRRTPRSPRSARRPGHSTGGLRRAWHFLSIRARSARVRYSSHIPGVDFAAAWERRVEGVIDPKSGLKAFFISAPDLIASKLAACRPQDIADAAAIRKAVEAQSRQSEIDRSMEPGEGGPKL
jgi:hypothetical protein